MSGGERGGEVGRNLREECGATNCGEWLFGDERRKGGNVKVEDWLKVLGRIKWRVGDM